MIDLTAQRQGQPLLFLGLLITGWCLLRVLTWQNPWPEGESLTEPMMLATSGFEAAAENGEGAQRSDSLAGTVKTVSETATEEHGPIRLLQVPSAPQSTLLAYNGAPIALKPAAFHDETPASHQPSAQSMSGQPTGGEAGHLLAVEDSALQPSSRRQALPRWRFDAWALLRDGSGARIETGIAPASYGASQVGGVLAYRLASSSRFRPAAYLRASRALVTGGESEGALGFRVRPFTALPLDLHVEARVTDRPGDIELRPAAFVAGGIDRAKLPAGLRLRGYGQAGYVHGDFATAFADGKLVAERELVRLGTGSASLGGGAWGGAQKGADRLDLGPTIALDLKLGKIPARLEADYRFRIAGNAEPGDGGVLTLSTGF